MSTTVDPDHRTRGTKSATTTPTVVDPEGGKRRASRREAGLALAIVALIGAVVVFGLVFPQLLAPAVGIAVLAVIIGLDWLLPCGELRRVSGRRVPKR